MFASTAAWAMPPSFVVIGVFPGKFTEGERFRRRLHTCSERPRPGRNGARRRCWRQLRQRRSMAVVKIIELIATSSKSSDDAVQQALKEARTSLRNIKAIDLVSTGLRGDDLTE